MALLRKDDRTVLIFALAHPWMTITAVVIAIAASHSVFIAAVRAYTTRNTTHCSSCACNDEDYHES